MLQPMTGRYTLALRRLAYEHHAACSKCERLFVQDDLYHLGYDDTSLPMIVGNCCKHLLHETAVRHGFHPRRFSAPSDGACLWRYMSLAKYISLLSTKALHFARMDTFDDPFEGAIGMGKHRDEYRNRIHEHMLGEIRRVVNMPPPDGYPIRTEEERAANISRLISEYENREPLSISERSYASCWHENKTESEALWKLYGGMDGLAVALRTTYGSLREGILDRHVEGDRYEIEIGRVHYIDYEDVILHHLDAPFRKRLAFEHEKEVRAILRFHSGERPFGLSVPVDLAVIIHSVVVSPLAPRWFEELVTEIGKRFECSATANKSSLNVDPLHF